MDSIRIILSGFWVTLMLTYLLGDVLRIFAGNLAHTMEHGSPSAEA
jgi:hypothetical protein